MVYMMKADFEINRPISNKYQITAEKNYFQRRQTDRHPLSMSTFSSFSKKENTTKNRFFIVLLTCNEFLDASVNDDSLLQKSS